MVTGVPDWITTTIILLAIPLGALLALCGCWIYERIRKQQEKYYGPVEMFVPARPRSWQAQHRRRQDKGKLIPLRHLPGGVGSARISQARLRAKR